MADRLNGLNDQVAEVKTKVKLKTVVSKTKVVYIKKRISDIGRIEQWYGGSLKRY